MRRQLTPDLPVRAVRRLGREARTAARRTAERVVPSVALLRRRSAGLGEPPPLGLVMVYRSKNAAVVSRLLEQGGPTLRVALWALDEVADDLASRTVGQGPGTRCDLLNACIDALDVPDDAWLVISDDDVNMAEGTVVDLVQAARLADLDVCQPTHSAASTHSWPINERHVWTLARTTRFV